MLRCVGQSVLSLTPSNSHSGSYRLLSPGHPREKPMAGYTSAQCTSGEKLGLPGSQSSPGKPQTVAFPPTPPFQPMTGPSYELPGLLTPRNCDVINVCCFQMAQCGGNLLRSTNNKYKALAANIQIYFYMFRVRGPRSVSGEVSGGRKTHRAVCPFIPRCPPSVTGPASPARLSVLRQTVLNLQKLEIQVAFHPHSLIRTFK